MGYFYGFKLHLIINEKGQFVALKMTKGNVDDKAPVPELAKLCMLIRVISSRIYLSIYMKED